MDPSHRSNSLYDLRCTVDFDAAPYTNGEWARSQLVFPWTAADNNTYGSTEAWIHVLGNHIDNTGAYANFNPATILSVGLLEAYKESRAIAQSPSPDISQTPNVHPYAGLFDDGDTNEDIQANLDGSNDHAPYPTSIENLGGRAYNAAEIRVQSSEVINMTNGFVAPCGLVKVQTNQSSGIMRLKVFLGPARS